MRAAVLSAHGEPPSYAEHPDPTAGEGEVLVRITAAPIAVLDLLCASGTSYFGQPALPYVPGVQGVGVTADGRRVWISSSAGHETRRRHPGRAVRRPGGRHGAAGGRRRRHRRGVVRAVQRGRLVGAEPAGEGARGRARARAGRRRRRGSGGGGCRLGPGRGSGGGRLPCGRGRPGTPQRSRRGRHAARVGRRRRAGRRHDRGARRPRRRGGRPGVRLGRRGGVPGDGAARAAGEPRRLGRGRRVPLVGGDPRQVPRRARLHQQLPDPGGAGRGPDVGRSRSARTGGSRSSTRCVPSPRSRTRGATSPPGRCVRCWCPEPAGTSRGQVRLRANGPRPPCCLRVAILLPE